MSVSEEMRLQFIKRLKRDLQKVSYPQPFCAKLYPETNCLAYAIGVKSPDYAKGRYFPGGLSGATYFLIPELIIPRFKSDLYRLGISCKQIEESEARKKTSDGVQIIAIFYSEIEKDFHVIRKDKEGGWSHKLGYELPPKKMNYHYEKVINSTYELVAYLQLTFKQDKEKRSAI